MAEVEEPQFLSLQARIAALNQSQSNQHQTFGKRPPPPIPPSTNRSASPARIQSTPELPTSTRPSSSITKQGNRAKGPLLPPPPIDRDTPRSPSSGSANTPPLPARNPPPTLPAQNATEASPVLPPQRTPLRRKASSSSISSTISGLSLNQARTSSSMTSASKVDTPRRLPPPLDQAKIPPLPPSQRGHADKPKLDMEATATNSRVPLLTVRSAPTVPIVERHIAPKMPPRPNGPPRLPSRSRERQTPKLPTRPGKTPPPRLPSRPCDEVPPAQPPRRLPPAATAPSVLSMGFSNKTAGPPKPILIRAPSSTSNIQELTYRDFDSAIQRGVPIFIKFYSPRCLNCQNMAPAWEKLGENFAFASDKLIIAQLDIFTHKNFHQRFRVSKYPTVLLFNGRSEIPERFQDGGVPKLNDMNDFLLEKTGISPTDPARNAAPSLNMSSKPTLAQVRAVQSRPTPAVPPISGCLACRDFAGPDEVASKYPRESLPQGDNIAYLAGVLCRPFTSLTDKARAIYRWLAFNIAYDTVAFFGNNVKHVDPKDTITTGLAVCGGYAGLFVAIAVEAGLECVMVTGHGKGYGHSPLKPGDPIPPCNPAGHAWNAVRIDDGEWKLLDACWGAGNVGNKVFNRVFKPSYFTMSNDEFGIKHFPQDDSYFFRSDGQVKTWERYMIGPAGAEPVNLYGSVEDHGLSRTSFAPAQNQIKVDSAEVVRFQFSKECEHWDHEKNGSGKPYCMVLRINIPDGKKQDFIPFDSNGLWWWVDISAKDLGVPGQQLGVFAVKTVNGQDARGMTRMEYLQKKGKCATGFNGICAWELV